MQNAGFNEGQYIPNISQVDGLEAGVPVTVSLTVPAGSISLFNMPLLPAPVDFSVSVTMAKEGP